MSKNTPKIQMTSEPIVNDEIQMPDTGAEGIPDRKVKGPKEKQARSIAMKSDQKRKYKGEQKIDSDLFRLKLAKARKNMSWDEKKVQLEDVEHSHFFHTFDSDGRKQKYSAAVGGHFHEIFYEENEDGVAIITGISEPLQMVKRTNDEGRMVTVAEPLPAKLKDRHTHEIEYIQSQTITKRTANAQAIEVATIDANKTAPIAGVSFKAE